MSVPIASDVETLDCTNPVATDDTSTVGGGIGTNVLDETTPGIMHADDQAGSDHTTLGKVFKRLKSAVGTGKVTSAAVIQSNGMRPSTGSGPLAVVSSNGADTGPIVVHGLVGAAHQTDIFTLSAGSSALGNLTWDTGGPYNIETPGWAPVGTLTFSILGYIIAVMRPGDNQVNRLFDLGLDLSKGASLTAGNRTLLAPTGVTLSRALYIPGVIDSRLPIPTGELAGGEGIGVWGLRYTWAGQFASTLGYHRCRIMVLGNAVAS